MVSYQSDSNGYREVCLPMTNSLVDAITTPLLIHIDIPTTEWAVQIQKGCIALG